MLKEIKELRFEKVVNLCVQNELYTKGSCEEYESLIDFINERGNNIKLNDLRIIAKNIIEHSTKKSLNEIEENTNIELLLTSALSNLCISHVIEK